MDGGLVMRIVQVLPEFNEGGVERGTVELSRELVKRGHESWVISRGGKLVEQLLAEGGQHVSVDVCSKNPLFVWPRVRALRKQLDLIKPDIIHARSRVPAWLCRFANRKAKRPFVTTVHGLNSISRYSRVMVSGDRVIAVGEPVREHVCKGYDIEPNKITVIERGVDLNAFDPGNVDPGFIDVFKQQHKLSDKYVVTSVGRVTYLKDYESLIKAVAKLAPTIPNLVALIVGGVHPEKTAYADSLKRLAEGEGVTGRVVFAGSQSKIAEVYALSDIVVNASLKMGNMGRTVVEALAMDKPVIATTWPGLDNVVKDDRNGYVIPTQDAGALAEAISKLHQNPPCDLRTTVPKEFTLDHMVDSILAVYEELLR
ncbi:MAG: glycosyltransferase family 4 protein [Phycisphaeraceae bacterium]